MPPIAICSRSTARGNGTVTGGVAADRAGASYGDSALIMLHTPNGRTSTVTDANGNVTAYAYDGLDRGWRTCFQTASSAACAGSPANYEQLSYDADGHFLLRRGSGERLQDKGSASSWSPSCCLQIEKAGGRRQVREAAGIVARSCIEPLTGRPGGPAWVPLPFVVRC